MKLFSGVSTYSNDLDLLTLVMVILCGIVTLIIFSFIIYYCFKYHASKDRKTDNELNYTKLELTWLSVTFVIFMGFFAWATTLYHRKVSPVKSDYTIFVYAKRWMWKFHHPNGLVEINHLHLPKNKDISFVMISEDVIHSFYLPDYRVKQDVLPEVYTIMNFHPLLEGTYPLFCAEYCGTKHSGMKGEVNIVQEKDYLRITNQLKAGPVKTGRELFVKHDCLSCHHSDSDIGPSLLGIKDRLTDDNIRRSILYPQQVKKKGYEAVMPSYKGQLSEVDIRFLIEYVKSMRTPDEKLL